MTVGLELSEEAIREACERAVRDIYRIPKRYAEARALAYFPSSGELHVSGGGDADPTSMLALDVRRLHVRTELVRVSRIVMLLRTASNQAYRDLGYLDTLKGEPVGRSGTWTRESAEAAERRSAEGRTARQKGARAR